MLVIFEDGESLERGATIKEVHSLNFIRVSFDLISVLLEEALHTAFN